MFYRRIALLAMVSCGLFAKVAIASDNFMQLTGNQAKLLPAHHDFCRRNPIDCGRHKVSDRVVHGSDEWENIKLINAEVNHTIRYLSDPEKYQKYDFWTYPVRGQGDCEDIALLKQKLLIAAGIKPSNILITVVIAPNQPGKFPDQIGHVVLTLLTDKGDLILDNDTDEIKPFRKTPYVFKSRQDQANYGRMMVIRVF